jgi:thiamine biosynthesis lipoprotein
MPTVSFEAIGTLWSIDIDEKISLEKEQSIREIVLKRIDKFDRLYSRFRNDSWVHKLSLEAGTFELPADAEPMFRLYEDFYRLTGGLMTPLIGQVLVDAGYDPEYSLKQHKGLSSPPAWKDIIDLKSPHITLKKPVLLDVGAIGKGYIIDIVAKLLEEQGILNYCVDAGGDFVHKSSAGEKLRVGLEDPRDEKKVIGVLTVGNKGMAGSAGNRRKWESFNHIINPSTLSSPEHILAVWTLADTAMLADALSTALYFAPAEILLKHYRFEYVIMYADGSVEGTLVGNPMLELY